MNKNTETKKGRPKKIVYQPGTESISYAKKALKNYIEMKKECRGFERENQRLIKSINVMSLVKDEESPDWQRIPAAMLDLMDEYLEMKEQIFLVCSSLEGLPEEIKSVIEYRCIQGHSIWETAEHLQISDSSVKRRQNEGIRLIAEQVEFYMWVKAARALGITENA